MKGNPGFLGGSLKSKPTLGTRGVPCVRSGMDMNIDPAAGLQDLLHKEGNSDEHQRPTHPHEGFFCHSEERGAMLL